MTTSLVQMDYVSEQDEGEDIGTSILRVQADDADIAENAEVTYSFAEGFPDAVFFSIDNETGVITNNILLVSTVHHKPAYCPGKMDRVIIIVKLIDIATILIFSCHYI